MDVVMSLSEPSPPYSDDPQGLLIHRVLLPDGGDPRDYVQVHYSSFTPKLNPKPTEFYVVAAFLVPVIRVEELLDRFPEASITIADQGVRIKDDKPRFTSDKCKAIGGLFHNKSGPSLNYEFYVKGRGMIHRHHVYGEEVACTCRDPLAEQDWEVKVEETCDDGSVEEEVMLRYSLAKKERDELELSLSPEA